MLSSVAGGGDDDASAVFNADTGAGGNTAVTHYLCVKCGELLMKVIWRAGMAMV